MAEKGWADLLPPLLAAAGLDAGRPFTVEPLTGGVSSDIVRVRLADGRELCAKRALARLKVRSDWRAPLERNHYEVAWLRRAGEIVPRAVPRVLGEDRRNGIALLEYLPPEDYRLWKADLLAGRVPTGTAATVGDVLGRIHAATLNVAEVAAEFATDHLIEALRIDPYLRFTAERHPDLAGRILAVVETTKGNKLALVHGDVSPKNILIAKADGQPVLLDAECAWFGDPAFDAAFCLNHLLLKAIHLPGSRTALLAEAEALSETWLPHFPVALTAGLDARTAALLPCLMLARVDGKSPVEYLSAAEQELVRRLARPAIEAPPATVAEAIAHVRCGLAA